MTEQHSSPTSRATPAGDAGDGIVPSVDPAADPVTRDGADATTRNPSFPGVSPAGPGPVERAQRRRGIAVLAGIGAAVVVAVLVIVLLVTGVFDQGRDAPVISDEHGGLPVVDASSSEVADESPSIVIDVYTDYASDGAATFSSVNDLYLRGLLRARTATVVIHPLALVDEATRTADDTSYAMRAANAAACVADADPEGFWAFHTSLLAMQPASNEEPLTDDELVGFARDTDVHDLDGVRACIVEGRFVDWVRAESDRAVVTGVGPSTVRMDRLPTVLVQGTPYLGGIAQSTEFRAFVDEVRAAG